jgi:NADPH:quinone reductase-like Zn-dependent oxidoreductase
MKAIVQSRYGSPDILRLVDVEKPTPKANEVLIRVYAASVNGSDVEGLTGKPLYARLSGLFKPGNPILGSDIAGRVEQVGSGVTQFQPGDEVFGEIEGYRGGFAEYACTPAKILARKPAGLSFEQAAALPQGAGIAVQGIRDKGKVQPGQAVLINGAGGSAGMFSVQLARYYGAEVTGVDNAGKLDFLRTLGADHVIDYARQDFTKTGAQYDLILDVTARRPVSAIVRVLKPGGSYFLVGGSVRILLQALLFGPRLKKTQGKSVSILGVQRNPQDSLFVAELCAAGKVIPYIDRHYPLSEVPEALRYVGEGRALGKIVITIPT